MLNITVPTVVKLYLVQPKNTLRECNFRMFPEKRSGSAVGGGGGGGGLEQAYNRSQARVNACTHCNHVQTTFKSCTISANYGET